MTGRGIWMVAVAALLAVAGQVHAHSNEIVVEYEAGFVIGTRRYADNFEYASFRGVPYAKAPTGERRFKELEPLDTKGTFNATTEGPVCFQTDIFYHRLMQSNGMSEDCIFANIHVPLNALPKTNSQPSIELEPPRQTTDADNSEATSGGLPILVFIHGGGFAFGSGDTDLHGPEYLVSKNVIVITFNYRLNVFGFLSLNSSQVPGNAGLRDMITLLKWVKRNARFFGGDPDNVTLGGQSAGAISAHLLTLSKAAEGLFKRAIMMSGTAITSFYSASPLFAQYIKNQLLNFLQITATDPDEIYQQLINIPAKNLMDANKLLIDQMGFTTFLPTVESSFPGVEPILEDYPEVLLEKGRGKNIPLLIGYTDSECETFHNRLKEFDFVEKSKVNPAILIPPKLLFSVPPNLLSYVAKKIDNRYYNGTVTAENFVKYCTESFFQYPVLKFIEGHAKTNSAPVYVYEFAYESDTNVLKEVGNLKYHGAGHVEDLTYVFKTNSIDDRHNWNPFKNDYDNMKNFMTETFVNFMTCSKPICDGNDSIWPPANGDKFLYEDIHEPYVYQIKGVSAKQQGLTKFFDRLTIVE